MEQKYLYLITEGIARSYYIDSEGNDITKMFIREEEFAVGESLFLPESLDVFEALENLKSLRFEAKKMKEIIYSDKAALLFRFSSSSQRLEGGVKSVRPGVTWKVSGNSRLSSAAIKEAKRYAPYSLVWV